jgi:hypothetical protein
MSNRSETGVVLDKSLNSIHLERLEADGGFAEVKNEGETAPFPQSQRRSSIAALSFDPAHDGARPNPVMVPMPDESSSPVVSRPPSRPMSVMSAGNRRSVIGPAPHLDLNFEEDLLRNPFEIPASTEFASRFDPKSLGGPAAVTAASRRSLDLDGRTESRMSGVSGEMMSERRKSLSDSYYPDGTEDSHYSPQRQVFDDIPDAGEYGRPLRPPKFGSSGAYRVARQELLRPKTLIMPGALAGSERPTGTVHIPEGFMLGEKPLPADARSSILNMGMGVPLSLAQRTFRSSLMVGGRREEEAYFRGQADEGEIYGPMPTEEEIAAERLPGKLYVSGIKLVHF